jgi:uncharacterized protein (TIGR03435 family)
MRVPEQQHMRRIGLTIVVVSALIVAGMAQQPSPLPAFEVASIRPNPDDTVAEGIALQPDGSVRFTAFRVRTLIAMAYRSEGIQRFDQLIGGPSWMAIDRFDIAARASDAAPQDSGANRLPAMLRALLRDRFRLLAHSDTRDLPAFSLVLARRDRRPGPQLRESTVTCPTPDAPSTDADPALWCGIRAAGGVITGRAVSAGQLAGNLSGYPEVDRFVTDRTGLIGRYDFRLEYSPGFQELSDTNGRPSLFTALTEQLGLTLRPETASLPVLIIDNIQRPTPN